MSNQETVRGHQNGFLRLLQQKKEPYIVEVESIKITVNPGVFPPTTDTRLLAKHIKVQPGNRVLDLTCGSGIFSVVAGLQGATGVTSDLNPEAVRNAEENISHHNLQFKVMQSDMFESIPQQLFVFIYSNGPYIEGEITDPLELAFFGAKAYIKSLFGHAGDYLAVEGEMLITFAEWGEIDFFETTAKEYDFNFEVVEKQTSSDDARTYRLYRFQRIG
jgi:release factor glutamine methyltransferase